MTSSNMPIDSLVRLVRAKVQRRKGGEHRIKESFERLGDQHGRVDYKKFKAALEREQIQLLGTQASNLFDYIDKGYTGQIDFEAFKTALYPHMDYGVGEMDKAAMQTRSIEKFNHGEKHMASVPHLRNGLRKFFLNDNNALAAFNRFRKGKNANSQISFNEFKAALRAFNFKVNDSVARELFNQIETSGDGKIDFKEFATEFFCNDTQRFLARTTDWILGIKKDRTIERGKKQASVMKIPEPFEVLKRKIRFGFGGVSCRLAFRRFKTTLCVKESVDFDGFKKALVHLGIAISEKDAKTVFDHVDEDKSGIVDYDEFQKAIYGGGDSASLEAKDWTLRNAREKSKRVAHFTDSCNLVRTPSQLYNLLRAMFVSVSSYQRDAFRKFMMTSGASDAQITINQMKRAIRLKGLKTTPGIAERLFAHLDTDGNGTLSFNEFAKAFFDENLSQKTNLNTAPAPRELTMRVGDVDVPIRTEEEQFLNEAKNRPECSAIIILRQAMSQTRVSPTSLMAAFQANKTQSVSTTKPSAVDLRGLRDALLSEGVKLHNNTLKAIFFELDRSNRGFITFKDFAILAGLRIPKLKRKSTLPTMQQRNTYMPSPSHHLRRKQRTHTGDKGLRGPQMPRRRTVARPTTAKSRRPNTAARSRPGTGSSSARYMKRSPAETWEQHNRKLKFERIRQQRKQKEENKFSAWS